MPKLPIDYSKSVMYKLVCNDLTIPNLYVGSSTDFTRRKAQHKKVCNSPAIKEYNLKVYQVIRANGGWDNWSMVLIENYPCENLHEKLKRERYWLETLKADLNCVVPTRTNKEYYTDNREDLLEKSKQYWEENRDVCSIRNKQYYNNHRDEIAETTKKYRSKNVKMIAEKKKKYYDKNAKEINEKRKDYHTQYRLENKDIIYEKQKEKVECPICCKMMRYDYRSKHIKKVH